MEPSNPEATASVLASVSQLEALIDDAMARHGLPAEKIALGGFSMGGGISLQVMARAKHCLGAVFALSSYLCDDSAAYKEFSAGKAETQAAALAPANEEAAAEGAAPAPRVPVFIAHGADDDFVLPAWGAATAKRLEGFGVPVKFTTIEGIKHEMNTEELGLLFEWLGGVLGF
jgi:phospholipase/carboxylesterase